PCQGSPRVLPAAGGRQPPRLPPRPGGVAEHPRKRAGEVGQWQAALGPAQEAVELYRGLAAANPDAYLPDLAGLLNTLANRLAGGGERQAALGPGPGAGQVHTGEVGTKHDA